MDSVTVCPAPDQSFFRTPKRPYGTCGRWEHGSRRRSPLLLLDRTSSVGLSEENLPKPPSSTVQTAGGPEFQWGAPAVFMEAQVVVARIVPPAHIGISPPNYHQRVTVQTYPCVVVRRRAVVEKSGSIDLIADRTWRLASCRTKRSSWTPSNGGKESSHYQSEEYWHRFPWASSCRCNIVVPPELVAVVRGTHPAQTSIFEFKF